MASGLWPMTYGLCQWPMTYVLLWCGLRLPPAGPRRWRPPWSQAEAAVEALRADLVADGSRICARGH
eukprot:11156723-Lingulodinium_polyedra.AAC.1